jgi:hypothetical protein
VLVAGNGDVVDAVDADDDDDDDGARMIDTAFITFSLTGNAVGFISVPALHR